MGGEVWMPDLYHRRSTKRKIALEMSVRRKYGQKLKSKQDDKTHVDDQYLPTDQILPINIKEAHISNCVVYLWHILYAELGILSNFHYSNLVFLMFISILRNGDLKNKTRKTYLKMWMSAITSQRPTSPHSLQPPISRNTCTYSSTDSQVRSLCWERVWTHEAAPSVHSTVTLNYVWTSRILR